MVNTEKIIGYWSAGWSADNPKTRNVGWGIPENGWSGFIDQWIKPAIDLGFTRFEIHNPFGCLANEPMQFDQYIHAKNAKLDFLTKDFAKSWRKITEKYEVIGYLGIPAWDADFLNRAQKPLLRDDWLRRMTESVNPILDAGMSLGMDSLAGESEHSHYTHFAKTIQALGTKVYIEPCVFQSQRHWMGTPTIITNQLYWVLNNIWNVPVKEHTGEFIQILIAPENGGDWNNPDIWLPQWIKKCNSENQTAMFNPMNLVNGKIKLEDYT